MSGDTPEKSPRQGIWKVLPSRREPPAEERPPLRRGLPRTRLELELLKAWS